MFIYYFIFMNILNFIIRTLPSHHTFLVPKILIMFIHKFRRSLTVTRCITLKGLREKDCFITISVEVSQQLLIYSLICFVKLRRHKVLKHTLMVNSQSNEF